MRQYELPMRFTSRQLLLGTAGIAILLGAIHALSNAMRPSLPGRICNEVRNIVYSPDATKLGLVLFSVRDSGLRRVDASHVTKLFDANTLSESPIIHRDFHKGIDISIFLPLTWKDRPACFAPSSVSKWETSVAFGSDSELLYFLNAQGGQIRVWDASLSSLSNDQPFEEADILAFALSIDGKWLATASQSTGVTVRNTQSPQGLLARPEWGWPLKFSPDGKSFAVTARHGTQLWDLPTQKLIYTLQQNSDVQDSPTCLAFSPNSGRVAVAYCDVLRIVTIRNGTPHAGVPEKPAIQDETGFVTSSRTGNYTYDVAFAPDGKLLASCGTYGVKFFDVSRKPELKRIVPDSHILCVAFSPDGKTYATGDSKGKLTIWDTTTGNELRSVTIQP